jgi:hypothetical protein
VIVLLGRELQHCSDVLGFQVGIVREDQSFPACAASTSLMSVW